MWLLNRKAGSLPVVDIATGVANARRAGADTWDPPTPTLTEKLICLERWYYFVRQKSPEIVLTGDELFRLEPSGLTDRELRDWYWGQRCEAARRCLTIVNTSYSKTAVRDSMVKEGLTNALSLMDPGTRESYDYVLKFLSD